MISGSLVYASFFAFPFSLMMMKVQGHMLVLSPKALVMDQKTLNLRQQQQAQKNSLAFCLWAYGGLSTSVLLLLALGSYLTCTFT